MLFLYTILSNYHTFMFATIYRLWHRTLDIVFPKQPLVRELERMDAGELVARAGRADGYAGKEIISLFDYRGSLVRQAVWELKYRGNKNVVRLLGEALYDELLAFLEEYAPLTNFSSPLLIPLPLSKKREFERGFNQCRLLCDVLLKLDGGRNFTFSTALSKNKDTPSQTKQDTRAKRLENLKGCFVANADAVKGRNIILIDDVATTGATIEEARRTLRLAGARKVIAFTIAH